MSKAEYYDALASRLAEANERIAAAEKRIAEQRIYWHSGSRQSA